MKPRHVAAEQLNVRELLRALKIDPTQNFYTLSASQVDGLLVEADRVRYRKPRNANGSRGRYFYARLQRTLRAPR
jgi:hypothetical protein